LLVDEDCEYYQSRGWTEANIQYDGDDNPVSFTGPGGYTLYIQEEY